MKTLLLILSIVFFTNVHGNVLLDILGKIGDEMQDAYSEHKDEIEKLDANLKNAFVQAKDSINNITEASKLNLESAISKKDTIKHITSKVKKIVENAKEEYHERRDKIVKQFKNEKKKMHTRKEVEDLVEKKNTVLKELHAQKRLVLENLKEKKHTIVNNFNTLHKQIKHETPGDKKEFVQMKWLKLVQKMMPEVEAEAQAKEEANPNETVKPRIDMEFARQALSAWKSKLSKHYSSVEQTVKDTADVIGDKLSKMADNVNGTASKQQLHDLKDKVHSKVADVGKKISNHVRSTIESAKKEIEDLNPDEIYKRIKSSDMKDHVKSILATNMKKAEVFANLAGSKLKDMKDQVETMKPKSASEVEDWLNQHFVNVQSKEVQQPMLKLLKAFEIKPEKIEQHRKKVTLGDLLKQNNLLNDALEADDADDAEEVAPTEETTPIKSEQDWEKAMTKETTQLLQKLGGADAYELPTVLSKKELTKRNEHREENYDITKDADDEYDEEYDDEDDEDDDTYDEDTDGYSLDDQEAQPTVYVDMHGKMSAHPPIIDPTGMPVLTGPPVTAEARQKPKIARVKLTKSATPREVFREIDAAKKNGVKTGHLNWLKPMRRNPMENTDEVGRRPMMTGNEDWEKFENENKDAEDWRTIEALKTAVNPKKKAAVEQTKKEGKKEYRFGGEHELRTKMAFVKKMAAAEQAKKEGKKAREFGGKQEVEAKLALAKKKEGKQEYRFGGEHERKTEMTFGRKMLKENWQQIDAYKTAANKEILAQEKEATKEEKKRDWRFGGKQEVDAKLALANKKKMTEEEKENEEKAAKKEEKVKTDPFDDYFKRAQEEEGEDGSIPEEDSDIDISGIIDETNKDDEEVFDEADVTSAFPDGPVHSSAKEDTEFATRLSKEENDWFDLESQVIKKLQQLNKGKPVPFQDEGAWQKEAEEEEKEAEEKEAEEKEE